MMANDIAEVFDSAKHKHTFIDKSVLERELSGFTVDDWRKLTQVHTQETPNGLSRNFWVEEKDTEFLVHNDEQEMRGHEMISAVGTVMKGAMATGIGALAGRFMTRTVGGMLVGACAGLGAGVLWGKHTIGQIEDVKQGAFPLHVPKGSLLQDKISLIDGQQFKPAQAILAGSDLNYAKLYSRLG